MIESGAGSRVTGSGAGETGGNKVKVPWLAVIVSDVFGDGDVGPVVFEDGLTVGIKLNKLGCLHFSPSSLTSKGKSATAAE